MIIVGAKRSHAFKQDWVSRYVQEMVLKKKKKTAFLLFCAL
jgi:hypothetical protein